jgi:DNA polymerase I-like protein with 3'-5' exonuclease and polymerase domains
MPIRDPEAGAIVRQAFIPRDNHYLIECDYGGIEVKASQWYHKDPTMQSYLDNPLTADMHADFMQLLFMIKKYDAKCKGEKTLRKGTKNGFTFPQFYGDYYGNNAPILWYWAQLHGKKINPKHGLEISSGKTIGQHLIDNGVKNFKQFEKHVQKIERNMWDVRFPVYKKWKEDQYQWYLKHGYLTSLSGFTFQGIMGKNDAVNYPIQAVAFHCLLWSVIRLTKLIKKYKMKTKLIFQVHDSVVADVPKEERDDYLELLKQVMCHEVREHWKWIITPLELEADCSELNGNWSKMKTIMEYIH